MTGVTGVISGVSISHKRASVEQIERACTSSEEEAVELLLAEPGVDEAFVLQTCNRAEAYVVTDDVGAGRTALAKYVESVEETIVHTLDHEASLRHLLRVSAGLESQVLGEDQILGQVREAREAARSAGGVGPLLEEALPKALHLGERARTETAIGEGTLSLASAAAELAASERDIAGSTALVVGAGEMGTLAAKTLDDLAGRVIIANRTLAHANHVADNLASDGCGIGLDALPGAVARADVVVSATAATRPVLTRETFAEAGETLVVDIAQPRDVAPDVAGLQSVVLHDLDALETVTRETREQRREAAVAVEAMIDEAFKQLTVKYKRKRADEVIAAMYEGAEHVKARELQTALSKLEAAGDVSAEQRKVVEAMADALVAKLLAPPTESLRDAAENDDWSTINTALHLFDPTDDPGEFIDAAPNEIPEEMRQQMSTAILEQLGGEDE